MLSSLGDFLRRTIKRDGPAIFGIAMAFAMAASSLVRASDSDGSSNLNGAFLTLSAEFIQDHLAFRSFSVTPSTQKAFIEACTHGKRIWFNGHSTPCISAEVVADGVVVQGEMPRDTDRVLSGDDVYVVSVSASRYATLRSMDKQECSAMRGYAATASASSASRPVVSATSLDHARVMNGQGRSTVFVPYDKDRDGNRLTHVFSVSNGQVVYVGKLPDWPERLIHIGDDGAPQVIVNRKGDAHDIQTFTVWPRVKPTMFAGEGG